MRGFRNHRPDLQRMKYETSNAIDLLQRNNVEPEEWRHFIHQPPVAPVVQAAPPVVAPPVVAQPAAAQQAGQVGALLVAAVQAPQALGPPPIPIFNLPARKHARGDATYAEAPGQFWPLGVRKMFCFGLLANGTQCRNTFRAIPIGRPRCHACIKANR